MVDTTPVLGSTHLLHAHKDRPTQALDPSSKASTWWEMYAGDLRRRPLPEPYLIGAPSSGQLGLCQEADVRWEGGTALRRHASRTHRGNTPGTTHWTGRAPQWWPVRTQPVPNVADMDSLVEHPPGDVFAATSFTIIQEDENGKVKIRRGEDWRRSYHNATVRAWDVPTHHMVGDFVSMARRMADDRNGLHFFGHDLLNAYRQWPVRHPSHNATFLHTEHGLTLWFHLAMCFGAAASVWNFNRVADALQLLTRMLLLLVGGHYVDDFNGIEYAEHSDSAFHAFRVLPRLGPQGQGLQGPATSKPSHHPGS